MSVRKCPLCGKAESAEHKPFCSKGCKDRDLLNWLGEGYRMKGPPADPDFPTTRKRLDSPAAAGL